MNSFIIQFLHGLVFFGVISICKADFSRIPFVYYPFAGGANDESGNGQDATLSIGNFDIDRFGKANN